MLQNIGTSLRCHILVFAARDGCSYSFGICLYVNETLTILSFKQPYDLKQENIEHFWSCNICALSCQNLQLKDIAIERPRSLVQQQDHHSEGHYHQHKSPGGCMSVTEIQITYIIIGKLVAGVIRKGSGVDLRSSHMLQILSQFIIWTCTYRLFRFIPAKSWKKSEET